jgi:hypothetical protein
MIRIGAALVFAVFAGAAPGQATPAPQSGEEVPKAPPMVKGLDLSAIDKSADAWSDFYQYACRQLDQGQSGSPRSGALGSFVLAPLGELLPIRRASPA